MTLELSALLAAAAALVLAILAGRQLWLLLAVGVYTACVSWIILSAMWLLMPAFGIALALGILGLIITLRDEVPPPNVTIRHERLKLITNNNVASENVGQEAY